MEEVLEDFMRHCLHRHVYVPYNHYCKFCHRKEPELEKKDEADCHHLHLYFGPNARDYYSYYCLECGLQLDSDELPEISFNLK